MNDEKKMNAELEIVEALVEVMAELSNYKNGDSKKTLSEITQKGFDTVDRIEKTTPNFKMPEELKEMRRNLERSLDTSDRLERISKRFEEVTGEKLGYKSDDNKFMKRDISPLTMAVARALEEHSDSTEGTFLLNKLDKVWLKNAIAFNTDNDKTEQVNLQDLLGLLSQTLVTIDQASDDTLKEFNEHTGMELEFTQAFKDMFEVKFNDGVDLEDRTLLSIFSLLMEQLALVTLKTVKLDIYDKLIQDHESDPAQLVAEFEDIGDKSFYRVMRDELIEAYEMAQVLKEKHEAGVQGLESLQNKVDLEDLDDEMIH